MTKEQKKGPWTVKQSTNRFKNEWLELLEDEVIRPDQELGTFATIRVRPGVSVLAIDDDLNAYLTAEYRYAIEEESVEVVSGAIEVDEPPLVAATRELREELGIVSESIMSLGMVHPLTSMLHSPAHLFLARNLSFVQASPESVELIRLVKVPFAKAVSMVMDSEIKHAPSCVLILKADQYLKVTSEELKS